MKSELEQLAKDLAAARKAGGAKVLYPEELKSRVLALYRRKGAQSHSRFAESLGVSPTAVTKWLRRTAPEPLAMVPVRVAKPRPKPIVVAEQAIGAHPITLSFRGVTIQLPLSTPPQHVARLALALAEVGAC